MHNYDDPEDYFIQDQIESQLDAGENLGIYATIVARRMIARCRLLTDPKFNDATLLREGDGAKTWVRRWESIQHELKGQPDAPPSNILTGMLTMLTHMCVRMALQIRELEHPQVVLP